MRQIAPNFVFIIIFHCLIKSCRWFPKKNNSIECKWYQSLDDKSAFSACILKVKFKKSNTYKQRKNKEELEIAHERTLKIPEFSTELLMRKKTAPHNFITMHK